MDWIIFVVNDLYLALLLLVSLVLRISVVKGIKFKRCNSNKITRFT